jgi:hypothetical protein
VLLQAGLADWLREQGHDVAGPFHDWTWAFLEFEMNFRNSRHPVLGVPVLSVVQFVAGDIDVECNEVSRSPGSGSSRFWWRGAAKGGREEDLARSARASAVVCLAD